MDTKKRKRLVLLDTHAILHRAYHALPDFSSSKGEPTGALYGLISMLVRIIAELKPDYLAAAFDLPGPTYRHAAFKEYKATRPKAEDDLIAQIKRSRDVLDAFGIPRYEKQGFEADDVLGTVVKKLKHQNNVDIIIASGDMDTLQLVDDDRVRVYTLKKGLSETVLYDEAGVRERFGFGPELLPDYKGLRGDPSDNIPGIKGIGEKTATSLVSQFGGLEKIYDAVEKHPDWLAAAGVKGATFEKIKEGREEAELSKELATIHRDVPIDFTLPAKTWRESANPTPLLDLLSELEFRSLIPRVRELLEPKLPLEKSGASVALSNARTPRTFSVGVLAENPSSPAGTPSIDDEEFQQLAVAVWLLDSSVTEPTLDDLYRAGKSHDFAEAKKNILVEIEKRGLTFVYEKIERPLIPILRKMERRGISIDRAFLKKLSTEYHGELDKIAGRIYRAAGGEFNISSPKQLGEVLFDKLGLSAKNQKKTAGGARSTRESELVKLQGVHPVIADVLLYRELSKLLSTYIDAIPMLLDKKDRLHTTFVQTGTSTGRLASQNPNLQNIPIKTELGRAIRRAFVAAEGYALVAFDYSQIELRIAALLSKDPWLMGIFKSGRDAHAEVAARVFKIKPEEVTYEQRRRAKVINFGILYGMGVNALKESLGTSRAEAQEFYNKYFEVFPRLARYVDEVKGQAAREGYTQTYFGRRRYFEGIHSPIPYVRAAAERMAVNAPMQGTQADLVKLAMIQVDELFTKENHGDKAHLLLQVHDELVFEIEEERVAALAPKIKHIMEQVMSEKERQGIPFIAEGKAGKNWGEMKPL
ncbi:hypothetical protein HYS79_00600 [Patescibacteria group bacterium]|nr:hypothetical protein [Patescibacteria group bacterium]